VAVAVNVWMHGRRIEKNDLEAKQGYHPIKCNGRNGGRE